MKSNQYQRPIAFTADDTDKDMDENEVEGEGDGGNMVIENLIIPTRTTNA